MKKFIAFVLSASMCLSLLTALSPAFAAYEQDGEKVAMMRMGDPEKDEPKRETIENQHDCP